ncbi:hypothetical protein FS837_002425, partial [Tulasnella sp. UAMH 9824]
MALSNSQSSNEPPGKPPAVSHGSTQANPANVDDPTPSPFDKVEPLKDAAANILQATPWPEKHSALTQQLLETIKSTPDLRNLPEGTALPSPDLRRNVEEVVKVLEDVRGRLESASSKYGARKKGLFGSIKGFFSSNSKTRSSEVLRSCQEDVEKVLAPLRVRLETELRAKDNVGPSSQIPQDIDPPSSETTPGVKKQHSPTGAEGSTAKQTGTTQDSIANPSSLHVLTSSPSDQDDVEASSQIPHNNPSLSSEATPGVEPQHNLIAAEGPPAQQRGTTQNSIADPPPGGTSTSSPRDQKGKRSVSAEVLNAAGKIFTAVDTVSGLIPIVGSYVGAAAKVGSAVVEMVQKMDENEQIAMDLEDRVSKLSDHIEYFRGRSARTGGEHVTAKINGLKSEITDIQNGIDGWKSTRKLKKAWSATDDSDALNASMNTVENALAEMQLLASLNITDLLEQLYTHNLLSRLGDGDYGTQSKSSDNATCLNGTRVDVLNRIDAWMEGESTAERVFWIRGMAGRGKSTIARTVTSRWKDRATCATFHVRRGRDATNEQVLCALARQLALSPRTEVASAILASVRANENAAHQSLEDQFQKLLIEPLQSLNHPSRPLVLVVDALDEFQDTQYPVEFIDLIHDHTSKLPANIKFLLTSRPEATLLNAVREGWQIADLDTIADTDVNADIKLFVEAEFSAIRQKRGKKHQLDDTWPSAGDIAEVVKMSQGLFQWARTATAYIGERSPDRRLRELLSSPSRGDRLGDLYFGILSKAFDVRNVHSDRRELLSWVLGTLVVTPHPVTPDVVTFLYADHMTFKGQNQDELVDFLREDILGDLTSLIHVPENPSEPMGLLHTSIRDFLTDQKWSLQQEYGIDLIEEHRRLWDVCLDLMGRYLRRNICDLSEIWQPTSKIRSIVDLK